MSDRHLVIPSARRLMRSLRDVGYDLPSAVADLVDNSIDAEATHVAIDLHGSWRGPYVRVADNGTGMTERQLDEAMRYGSARRYAGGDLGHFGLGLKTASLSQCRRLTVATRTTPPGRVRVRRWDLDHVADHDAWILEHPRVRDCRPELLEPLHDTAGTVVMWEHLDRILGRRRPDGDAAERRLQLVRGDVHEHLAMVFHRFLAGENRSQRVGIALNGERVAPWDPFARSEPLTQKLPRQTLRLEHDGTIHRVRVRPHVLPNQHHFSSPEAHQAAAGPQRWNRQQGLYIYRQDRMIQSGGWSRFRTLDEHSKLARIALDIPATADDAFPTNVAKMRVKIPDGLRPQLRVLIAGVVGRAQDVYRQRVRLVPTHRSPEESAPNGEPSALHTGDHWPLITEILERELAEHPEVLDRVLVALANASPRAPMGVVAQT